MCSIHELLLDQEDPESSFILQQQFALHALGRLLKPPSSDSASVCCHLLLCTGTIGEEAFVAMQSTGMQLKLSSHMFCIRPPKSW